MTHKLLFDIREGMFKCMLFLGIFLILAPSLAACSPQNTVTTPEPTTVATAVAPKTQHTLNVLHPQSPEILNPHFSRSLKDFEPARIVYEPLASFNENGQLVPILADEIPTLENGDLASDGKSVIWKLRQDVRWSDGETFNADDVVFTYAFITDPDAKASTATNYNQVEKVERLDDFAVKITFKDVNPAWAIPFVGHRGVILPQHIFEAHKGAAASKAPGNTIPVGTGPYFVKEPGIKPQEVLLLGSQIVKTTKIVFERNPYYRFPDKIFFDRIIWRGGGTAAEAARLLIQEGSLDLAYSFDLVDPTTLSQWMDSAKGKPETAFGSIVLKIALNRTDPNTPSSDGEYSSRQVQHPFFGDAKIRKAVAHAINRDAIAQLYGEYGKSTYVNLVAPPTYRSTSSDFYQYDLGKARALLDDAGFIDTNGDGFREKDNINIKLVFQGAVDVISQKAQIIIQQDLKAIGIDTQLKIIDPSIMLGPGTTNPDSVFRFNADMLIVSTSSPSPDPSSYMANWTCTAIPQKENKWTGLNFERWCNEEYESLLQKANKELDLTTRQQMFIKLNDMLVEDVVMIPVVWRASAVGITNKLAGPDPTPWDTFTWNIQDWRFNEQP